MIRIDGSPIAPQADTSPPAQRGEQGMVKDATSMLADGAEELSLHHAEKVEAKEFDDRDVEADKPPEWMEIKEIEAYLEAAQQLQDSEKLVHLAKRMQSSQENPRELA